MENQESQQPKPEPEQAKPEQAGAEESKEKQTGGIFSRLVKAFQRRREEAGDRRETALRTVQDRAARTDTKVMPSGQGRQPLEVISPEVTDKTPEPELTEEERNAQSATETIYWLLKSGDEARVTAAGDLMEITDHFDPRIAGEVAHLNDDDKPVQEPTVEDIERTAGYLYDFDKIPPINVPESHIDAGHMHELDDLMKQLRQEQLDKAQDKNS
jgi:hypothetical protein